MKLLLIFLADEQKLESVLSLMVEAGISDASILTSEGLGPYLAKEVPIFAGLRQFFSSARSRSRTIFALAEDSSAVENFKKLLAVEGLSFSTPGLGVMIILSVESIERPPVE